MSYKNILQFWFGRVEETIVPSKNRARVWFGDLIDVDTAIKDQFNDDVMLAIAGKYDDWAKDPHSELALIILLDQFSRHIFHGTSQAFDQDAKALAICEKGMSLGHDHHLSLIERVFYYYPLLHAEDIQIQEQSLLAYQVLAQLAMPETKVLYDSFLRFSMHHYDVIRKFNRFPQRNAVLGRESSSEELIYLKELESE